MADRRLDNAPGQWSLNSKLKKRLKFILQCLKMLKFCNRKSVWRRNIRKLCDGALLKLLGRPTLSRFDVVLGEISYGKSTKSYVPTLHHWRIYDLIRRILDPLLIPTAVFEYLEITLILRSSKFEFICAKNSQKERDPDPNHEIGLRSQANILCRKTRVDKLNFFLGKHMSFYGANDALFWNSGDISVWVSKPYSHLVKVYMMYVPRYSPLMWHLVTSWQPAWQPVIVPHMPVSAEVGCSNQLGDLLHSSRIW